MIIEMLALGKEDRRWQSAMNAPNSAHDVAQRQSMDTREVLGPPATRAT